MKFIVSVCVLLQVLITANCKVLPNYLADLACKRSDPQYNECFLQFFEKSRPYLAEGIPEIGIPRLEPFRKSIIRINRKLNDHVNINATMTNSKITGIMGLIVEKMSIDPKRYHGELSFIIPNFVWESEYDILGQLFVMPLESKGFFKVKFPNIKLNIKGSLKETFKNGIKYFKMDKATVKITSNGVYLKMVAQDPADQYAADVITKFVHAHPKRTTDAVNSICNESATKIFKEMADDFLAKIPTEELLPE